jgi:hypothetical protein
MKNESPHGLYECNPETGNYIIEIALDKYEDVFNEWDHATYGRRDMEPELAFFLEECSGEIPAHHGTDLVFYLPRQAKDTEKESIISKVIKGYYEFYATTEHKALSRIYRQRVHHVLLAAFLLAPTYLFNFWQRSAILSLIKEGLVIGSWFFLWESISFFIFGRSKYISKIRTYERLAKANICFRYEKEKPIV